MELESHITYKKGTFQFAKYTSSLTLTAQWRKTHQSRSTIANLTEIFQRTTKLYTDPAKNVVIRFQMTVSNASDDAPFAISYAPAGPQGYK